MAINGYKMITLDSHLLLFNVCSSVFTRILSETCGAVIYSN